MKVIDHVWDVLELYLKDYEIENSENDYSCTERDCEYWDKFDGCELNYDTNFCELRHEEEDSKPIMVVPDNDSSI